MVMLLGTGWFWHGRIQAAPAVETAVDVTTPSPSPIPTPSPAVFLPAPPAFRLPASRWIGQTFNNCGPAATAMALQHFGFNVSQEEIKNALRTTPDDKNVFAAEIVDYLSKYGVSSRVLFNGSLDTIKLLLANGIPVLIEDWLNPNEDIGHVALLVGYDDVAGVLIADDPYHGPATKLPYAVFEEQQWKPFNREYLPLYRPEQVSLVQAIVGADWDETAMYRRSLTQSQAEIAADSQDMYAWFNLGAAAFSLGEYDLAVNAFDASRQFGWPQRLLWYHIIPVQAYNRVGDFATALELAQQGMWFNESAAELQQEAAIARKGLEALQ